MKKSSGILLPIFSLPSDYGIGDFGKGCYNFIDFLSRSGQRYWQILPLVQTGYGNSPYSSVCSTSISPYYISLDQLVKEGLLTNEEAKTSYRPHGRVDYEFLYKIRYPLLRLAFSRFDKTNQSFNQFVEKGEFTDYAIFMALKENHDYTDFTDWEDEYKFRNKKAINLFVKQNQDKVLFWQFLQFIASEQWSKVKSYANEKGISIIGDLPLYVALDSVDVWANPKLYKLDDDLLPKKVAGVPPDYFCQDGQLWGNPVYDYAYHQKRGFTWWAERIEKALTIYDYVRIDHFRGLDRYYEVEPTAPNAKDGKWIDVPSKKLFDAIHKKVDKRKIIAEDLGIIDDGVRKLLKEVGYPGMKVLSFAFDGQPDNLYLPQNLPVNALCYTGTHDNDTLMGLIATISEWDKTNLINGVQNSLKTLKMPLTVTDDYSLCQAIIELGLNSKAKLFIMPMQDICFKYGDYRINEPGTVKNENWTIRFEEGEFNFWLSDRLLTLTKKYGR